MRELALDVNRGGARRPFRTRLIGRVRLFYGEVRSTNAVLARIARVVAVEGTVVIADAQEDARGADGGRWPSPPGLNLYASVLLRPQIPPGRVGVFASQVAQVLVEALRLEGVDAEVRWPDRAVVAGKALGAVCCKVVPTTHEPPDYLLVGVAVNLNVTTDVLTAGLGDAAAAVTSVRAVLGREVDRLAFGQAFLTLLDEWYAGFRAEGLPPVVVGERL